MPELDAEQIRYFQLWGGTWLPAAGMVLTLLAGIFLGGARRWTALFTLPLLTAVLCLKVAEVVFEYPNVVAAGLYLMFFVLLAGLYPILIGAGIYRLWRRYRSGPDQRL